MCGSTNQENQISDAQQKFYDTMTSNYNTAFGENQAITGALTKTFSPILAAGPSQEGFSQGEKDNMNAQATEGTALAYSHASDATQEALAGLGGGNAYLPSGTTAKLAATNANAAAQQEATAKQNIVASDYATGRSNFDEAASALGSTAGLLSPTAYSGSATSAGSAASSTASTIAQQQMSAWQVPLSGAMGVLGQAVGKGGALAP